jgi:hypothetical protein
MKGPGRDGYTPSTANTKMRCLPGSLGLSTFNHIAPELLHGDKRNLHPGIDVYGAGQVLYECLTLRPLFRGMPTESNLDEVLGKVATILVRRRPSIPEVLAQVVARAIAADVRQRYRDAVELLHALEPIMLELSARSPANLGEWAQDMSEFLDQLHDRVPPAQGSHPGLKPDHIEADTEVTRFLGDKPENAPS